MPRGCDNPNSRFNNQPSAAPWAWDVSDRWDNGNPCKWASTRHTMTIVPYGADFRICTTAGAHLVGPKGRFRTFKSLGAAQLAADIVAGVA